jgi:HAD superfamily hydrolase (TIGR01490 family)
VPKTPSKPVAKRATKAKVAPEKIEAAFFDVDNTILRGSSSFLFGKAAFKRKFFSRKDFVNFAWHQARFIARGETAKTMNEIKDRALGLIAGHRVEELSVLTDEVYDDYISPKLWPETVRIAQQHVKDCREVWLITAAPIEIAEVIALRLGFTGGLGTIVERKDGVLTGRLDGKPLHGKAKYKAMKHLAAERNISLKRSYAYSDSVNDLPMLTHVGHPVAINPDKFLRTHAKAAGWKILDFKKRELRANR